VDDFSKRKAETLAPHHPIDDAIEQELEFKLPYGWMCHLLEVELQPLKAYIETNLPQRFIQQSSTSAEASILLVKTYDGGLQLCMNYQVLNWVTI
jgi:hypothetical protein